ncbi:intracellular multiplication and macrophage-killing domain-containing protein [Ditylenchus destructor]|nr:intracellular multiplication and macrophage-killing domain-containing protein [Ditylenchus destructor]
MDHEPRGRVRPVRPVRLVQIPALGDERGPDAAAGRHRADASAEPADGFGGPAATAEGTAVVRDRARQRERRRERAATAPSAFGADEMFVPGRAGSRCANPSGAGQGRWRDQAGIRHRAGRRAHRQPADTHARVSRQPGAERKARRGRGCLAAGQGRRGRAHPKHRARRRRSARRQRHGAGPCPQPACRHRCVPGLGHRSARPGACARAERKPAAASSLKRKVAGSMPYLKQAGAFVVSRPFLALLAVVLAACVIWFTGDLLALSGVRPMASREVRLALIVLLLLLGILWLASGPYSLVGVGALCLLIWHAGPTLAIGEAKRSRRLERASRSWVAVLSLYALYGCFRLWQALRSNDDLLARFLFRKALPQEHEAAKEELRRVAAGIQAAVAALRKMRGFGRLHRMLDGKRHLYELPWYMVLGSPGVGKTTVLRHSGLQFPLARQWGLRAGRCCPMLRPKRRTAIGGSRTRRCSSTPRAATPPSAAMPPAIPPSGAAFLACFARIAWRAPINGVIVVLSVAELLAQGDAERSEHAALVRDRLAELRQVLGIRFPVYVIVTQIDRLRGFREYFHSLTSDKPRPPLGFHLAARAEGAPRFPRQPGTGGGGLAPTGSCRVRAAPAADRGRPSCPLERGVRRRAPTPPFRAAARAGGLSSRLLPLLEQVFLSSRFDDTQNREALRGVYFTSGAQAGAELPADGATLLQRMRRRLAETRDVPSACASQEHADPEAARGQQGFFIQGVLARVIIPEAHLVRPNLRWEFRFRLMRILGHALVIVLFVWLAGALALSFGNNQRYLEAASQRTNALSLQVRSLFDGLRTTDVPDALNAARELPSQPGLDLDDPGGAYLYGLYTAPGVLAAAGETYARLQNRTLLPAIVRRMEVVLSQRVKEGDAKAAYDALRAYKLLFDRSRYMKGGAAGVCATGCSGTGNCPAAPPHSAAGPRWSSMQ